jgi:hypothetical protein
MAPTRIPALESTLAGAPERSGLIAPTGRLHPSRPKSGFLHGFVSTAAAEKLFRHKVIAMLREEGLLTEERIELLMSWRHSGFRPTTP